MAIKSLLVLCLIINGCLGECKSREEIVNKILSKHKNHVIPITDDEALKLNVEYSLLNIAKADVDNAVDINVWLTLSWKDRSLSFTDECTTFKQVSVPASEIWTPDMYFYGVYDKPEQFTPEIVKIYSDGKVWFVSQYKLRVPCTLSSDTTVCRVSTGSWTYSSEELFLTAPTTVSLDDYYSATSMFTLVSANQTVNSKTYPCCPEAYQDVELTFTFKGKTF